MRRLTPPIFSAKAAFFLFVLFFKLFQGNNTKTHCCTILSPGLLFQIVVLQLVKSDSSRYPENSRHKFLLQKRFFFFLAAVNFIFTVTEAMRLNLCDWTIRKPAWDVPRFPKNKSFLLENSSENLLIFSIERFVSIT